MENLIKAGWVSMGYCMIYHPQYGGANLSESEYALFTKLARQK